MAKLQKADLNKLNDALNKYVRPPTYPVAIKMCGSLDEVPSEAKRPIHDWGLQWPICQAITAAARKGWTVAVGLEDQPCPLANISFGFGKVPEGFMEGKIQWSLLPKGEPTAKYSQAIPRFEYSKYKYVVTAPIEEATFSPDLILIHGLPAQISRLVQGRLFLTGGTVPSTACLGITCTMEITKTMLLDDCQFILPGAGPRLFCQIHDHEMAFAIPASKVDLVTRGLPASVGTGAGYDYPQDIFLNYEFPFPPSYVAFNEDLRKGEGL